MKKPSALLAAAAVAHRELRIFFRYRTWVVAMIIWPSLFPLVYIFGSRALAGPHGEGLTSYAAYAGTTDYVGYILTGTFLWMWLNMMLWNFGTSLRTEQQRGTLETSWLSPAPRWFLLVGSALADAVHWSVYMLLGAAEFYFLFGFRIHGSVPLLLLILGLSMLSVYGLGMIFASAVLWVKEINIAVNVVRGTMMIFCGMTYPITVLPAWMRSVSAVLPLTHSIGATRSVVAGAGWSAVVGDLQFLTLSGLVLLALGFTCFAASQRLVERQGSLGLY